MPWSITVVIHYGQQYIGQVALYLYELYSVLLVDGHLPQYEFTHILLHAAFNSCRLMFYVWCLHVHSGSCWLWLHWQHCSGLSHVCIVTVSQEEADRMMHLSFDWIWICSHFAEVIVESWFTVVDQEKKMISKKCGKSWGIYYQLQVKIELVTTTLHSILKMNYAAYCGRFQGFPTILGVPVSLSDIVGSFCGINSSGWQPNSDIS